MAAQTHSDVVGIDVVWTKNLWISFPEFNPSRVDWKHKVKLSLMHNKKSMISRDNTWCFFFRTHVYWQAVIYQSFTLCRGLYVSCCTFVSLFPQEVGETGNGRLLRDSQGRIFLYLFLLLFSGFWPSFRGYSSLHSCCWSTWWSTTQKRKLDTVPKSYKKRNIRHNATTNSEDTHSYQPD